ncbi:MAG TPA: hypothetical protein VFG68_21330, partial [Fimbriiglobus sp.]|nr:hypothetical protein [Fimbriiglobus sp.]
RSCARMTWPSPSGGWVGLVTPILPAGPALVYTPTDTASATQSCGKYSLDFRALLRRRKKIGRKLPLLERRLQQMIDFRHGIVHHFSLDFGLRKPDIEGTLETVQVLVDLFVEEVERRRGVPIRDR